MASHGYRLRVHDDGTTLLLDHYPAEHVATSSAETRSEHPPHAQSSGTFPQSQVVQNISDRMRGKFLPFSRSCPEQGA